ncbi:hypothetical protein ASPZODRAFT_134506 [Penicilliopsis zonata CBS 506.65]|uniref:Condensation domain-containing protein n=1 Tax=Penicilliopsis zonata CBS 506.65 TaxID=1073090 RepID=A0A1L9SD35_9EURO|nr:hypothetical protein ASPZODRAFT_134506 [Penicilliopsis zonata CBS 506.65]OJJ45079.1 hypothetical protein ASPZODRAFT_134506 [Penicilliopsis zonata CBS 506.65]
MAASVISLIQSLNLDFKTFWRWIPSRHYSSDAVDTPVTWERHQNLYARPFDPFEQFFSDYCAHPDRPGFRSLDVVATVSVSFATKPPPPAELIKIIKNAWMRMRYLHPSLAAESTRAGFQYAPFTSRLSVEEWVEDTFVLSSPEYGQELGVPASRSSSRVKLYYLPSQDGFRLTLCADHMVLDGQGTGFLFHDLFTEMARLEAGGQVIHEPLGADLQRLPCGSFDTLGISARQQELLPPLSLPPLRPDAKAFETLPVTKNAALAADQPGIGRTQAWTLSEEETSALFRAIKAQGLRFTPFVHAAILHAERKMNGRQLPANTTYGTSLIFDIRNQCRDSHTAALRIGFWPIQLKLGDSIRQTAHQLNYEYTRLAQNKAAAILKMVPYLRQAASVYAAYTESIHSFIGDYSLKVREQYGSFRVQDISAVAQPTDQRVYVGIQTFRDRLTFNVAYNDAFHDAAQVEEFLNLLRETIKV